MEELFANIIVDVSAEALNKSFVFKVSEDLKGVLKPGDKVIFPFGKYNADREGFVLEILTLEQLKSKNFYKKEAYFKKADAISNLKTIKSIAKNKIAANEILLKMAIFMCKEYYAPISMCLNTVIPVKRVINKNKKQIDVVEKYEVVKNRDDENNIQLNDDQLKISNDIISDFNMNAFSEHLIFGITGSGKTEVYIKVIEEVLKKGRQVIVLIPEIALTHQTVIRLKEKFSDNLAIIHSRMSAGERYIQYKKCEDGKAQILVGPRSAIFAPFENLGLVVIDEVNDPSYKSDTTPRYDTLSVARFRAKEQNATLISLSATPGINLYYEAENGNEIKCHKLVNRASGKLPDVILVDMKNELKSGNKCIFSKLLVEKINDRLEKKEQVMLYMNRRGYDRIFTCKSCGQTYKCPHCDVALVSHNDGKLKCHYCGFEVNEPMTCPNCNSTDIERYGTGTEKLEELCMETFKNARVLRMDKDTTSNKFGHDKIIEKFRKGEADILIGTQMIVKGHDFPNVTLVAIMRADLSLYAETYKASENTFSMLTQCVGRSGRKTSGESVIQGYDIDNFVIKAVEKQDFEKFYQYELGIRKKLNYPPFKKLLNIHLSSNIVAELDSAATALKTFLEKKDEFNSIVLGPAKANPEKIKDIYRREIIVKCDTIEVAKKIRTLSHKFIEYIDKANVIKVIFDIE